MPLRLLMIGLVLLVAGPLGWRLWQSPAVQAWWHPAPPPRPIVFDNGTVRALPPAASGPAAVVSPGLKKCRRGERIVYTDSWCPEGSTPVSIDRGTVNVVQPAVPATAARVPGSPAGQPGRLPHARDVLTNTDEPSIRDQHLERTIDRMR
jgi:hypothetical protein